MSRFEKICWMWRDTYETQCECIPFERWLLLEELATDYDYFHERLVMLAGLAISQEAWRKKSVRKSKNASTSCAFPAWAWEDWSRERQDGFVRIRGNTMTKLGYSSP